jgi:hypothetical protein
MKYLAILCLLPFAAFATDNKPTTPSVSADASATSSATSASTSTSAVETGPVTQSLDVAGDHSVTVAQGAQVLYGCGASVNGGGSNGSDAAFLGFQWVTKFCKDAQMAAFYFGLGDYQTACDILRTGAWGKQAEKRGVKLPTVCLAPAKAEAVPNVVVIDGESCASKERAERVFEKCVAK